jgi:predicted RNA-binding Zn-ribbon protein involved in translation (DUF1610 family)
MTCPECGAIQARRNKCNRCSFNFETKEFEYELLSGKTCPKCSNQRVVKWQQWKTPGPVKAFQVMPMIECLDCSCVWEDSAPAWLLIFGLVFCLGVLLLGLSLIFSGPDRTPVGAYFIAVAGFLGFAGCIQRLLQLKKKN